MEEQFVPYEQALALKELGFDEPCIAHFRGRDTEPTPQFSVDFKTEKNSDFGDGDYWFARPLWQQAFEWFRKQYGLHGTYTPLAFEVLERDNDFVEWGCVFEGYPEDNFESARINCFNKIVEMIKEKS